MKARLKQKRVFQHQSRTTIPPETIPDEVYDDYKYRESIIKLVYRYCFKSIK